MRITALIGLGARVIRVDAEVPVVQCKDRRCDERMPFGDDVILFGRAQKSQIVFAFNFKPDVLALVFP